MRRKLSIARAGIFTGIVLLMLTGCVGNVWDRYAKTDYGPSRAEKICHPYGRCSRGIWLRAQATQADPLYTRKVCRRRYEEKFGKWSQWTVTKGMEIARCMRDFGYHLGLSDQG